MSAVRQRGPLTWYAQFTLMSAVFAVAVGYGIVLPVLPILVERLTRPSGLTALSWHTGLLTGSYSLALFLFAPLWGRVSDRYSRPRMLLFGLGGFASTLIIFAVFDSLPMLYLGRFLSGVCASAVMPVAYAFLGDRAPTKEWRAHRFALLNIAGTAGFLIGPMFGSFALVSSSRMMTTDNNFGISAPLFATSSLALLAGLMVWWLLPDSDRSNDMQFIAPKAKNSRRSIVQLLSLSFVTALAVGAFEVGLSLRGTQTLELSTYQIGIMFTECSLVMFMAQALVFSPFVKPEMTRHLVMPGLLILAVGLAAVPFADDFLMMTLAVALVAASAGILSPIATYWISLGGGETQGAELGRQTAAASLGQAAGSVAGGMLFDATIVPNAGFIFPAALVVAGLVWSAGLSQRLARISS